MCDAEDEVDDLYREIDNLKALLTKDSTLGTLGILLEDKLSDLERVMREQGSYNNIVKEAFWIFSLDLKRAILLTVSNKMLRI